MAFYSRVWSYDTANADHTPAVGTCHKVCSLAAQDFSNSVVFVQEHVQRIEASNALQNAQRLAEQGDLTRWHQLFFFNHHIPQHSAYAFVIPDLKVQPACPSPVAALLVGWVWF